MSDEKQTEQNSISVDKDFSGGVLIAGKENIANVNITQHITQLPPEKSKEDKPKSKNARLFIPVCISGIIAAGVVCWWWFVIYNVIKPFEGFTYGIIVAPFKENIDKPKYTGKEIQSSIQNTLNFRFKEWGINDAEARKAMILIESHEEARQFGKKYQAELVIWGSIEIQGIIPNITVVDKKSEASEIMEPETTIGKDSLCHVIIEKNLNEIRFPALTDEPIKLVSFVSGLKSYRQGNYKKAIEYFTYSIPDDPIKSIDSSRIFFYRGNTWNDMKEYNNAINDYTKAISINPKYDEAYNSRGLTYQKKGEYDKAIEEYTATLKINQNFTCAYINRGCVYRTKNDYDKAITDYNSAVKIDSKNPLSYLGRGDVYQETGEYDKAIKDYTKTIQLGLEHECLLCSYLFRAYHSRGDLYLYLGKYDEAIEDYSWYIDEETKEDDIFNKRGFAYHTKGEHDKAIADYTKAIQINTKNTWSYNSRGLAYQNKGKYDKAIADYTKAIQIDSESSIKYYTQAIKINPKNTWAYSNRGYAYQTNGEYGKAIEDYTRAIEINPKDVLLYNNISWLLATCPDDKYRNGDKAIEFIKKAKQLQASNHIIWNIMAAVNAEIGKFELAVKNQEKAIEMLSEKDKDKHLSEYTEHLNSYKAKKPWREKPKAGK